MNRRHFIHTSGLSLASLLISDATNVFAGEPRVQRMHLPDEVSAIVNGEVVQLTGKGQEIWTWQNLVVHLNTNETGITVSLQAPGIKLSAVTLRWHTAGKMNSTILNDNWERTYGDSSWHTPAASEILPWYFFENNGGSTNGFGVKTGAAACCYWQTGNEGLSLTMDTRCGSNGVELGDRVLKAATLVTMKSNDGESPFHAARRFTAMMCNKARMPKQPVYGINDWYFTYGNNSEKLIIEHTELMAPMASGLTNRPFSVIDAGWFRESPSSPGDSSWGDSMSVPNQKFGDMQKLAGEIKDIGMRPGIWTRPLCASHKDAATLLLPVIKGREEKKPILDPSIPENIERIKDYFKRYKQWGFEMVKFDYTSFDIFGKWGFEMLKDRSMSVAGWGMHDSSKTNAEIVSNMYQAIREAAGDMYIIGCNTFSHLSAGLFELNRIGDDTSGNEWGRTRKMGVNTLAFRGIQHGHFYAADPDCVGITSKVPWEKNRQWMDLVAKSGVPLFISAQPGAIGTVQKEAIKAGFKFASENIPLGEPLDWMQTALPKNWLLNGKKESFDWS